MVTTGSRSITIRGMTRALLIAVLLAALHAGPAFAQTAEPVGCVYDPAQGRFRGMDVAADEALVRETLAGRDTEASRKILEERVVFIDGRRFEAIELMTDTPDGLNAVLVDKAMVAGVRFFGVSDPYADRIATLVGAIDCAFQVYAYRPIVYGAWIEERPFQFKYPALAVERSSFRKEGGIAHATGFLMRGHPHADSEDKYLYLRMIIAADCDAKTVTLLDERGYGANAEALTRFTPTAGAVALDDVSQPGLRALAQIACNPPAEWPEATLLKDGLDKFSEMVHQAAHAEGG